MYRSRSARSTRSARGSTKSRRAGSRGGFADRIRRAAESGPTRKWVKVMRPPAAKIRFLVSKWVPFNELTEEERLEYDKMQAAEKQKEEMVFVHESADGEESKEAEGNEQTDASGAVTTVSTNNTVSAPESAESTNNVIPVPESSFGNESTDATVEGPPAAAKRELAQETTGQIEEPPTKRVKVGEQASAVPEDPMV